MLLIILLMFLPHGTFPYLYANGFSNDHLANSNLCVLYFKCIYHTNASLPCRLICCNVVLLHP